MLFFGTQVRDKRPNRERTMDDVEKQLLTQQQLISAFLEKVRCHSELRFQAAPQGKFCFCCVALLQFVTWCLFCVMPVCMLNVAWPSRIVDR